MSPTFTELATFDASRPDFAPYGFTCERWTPAPMRRPDRHNEIELNYLESGSLTYLLGGRKVRVSAGRLTAFWAAIPHQIIDYGKEPEYFVATIPLAWFLGCKLPEAFVQPLLRGQMVCASDANRTALDGRMFSGWVGDLSSSDPGLAKAVRLEIEARLLRLALDCPVPNLGRPSRPALSNRGLEKAEQIACLIAQRYGERLTVETIARNVGLHPNYAMSLFQKVFGTTFIDYLTQHRVSHAQRLLVTSDLKIVDIAMDSGFGSVSRFNEAFLRACGCPPRDYRREHLIPALSRQQIPSRKAK